VSSIDTALLLAGVLTARQKFADDKEIVRLATAIYERADFKWMSMVIQLYFRMAGTGTGFLKSRWILSAKTRSFTCLP